MKILFSPKKIALSLIVSLGISPASIAQNLLSISSSAPQLSLSVRFILKTEAGVIVQVREPQTLKPLALSWFFCNLKSDGQYQRTFAAQEKFFEHGYPPGGWYLEGTDAETRESCETWVQSIADQLSTNDMIVSLDWNDKTPIFRTALLTTGSPQTATEELRLEGPQLDPQFDQTVTELASSYKTSQPIHRNHLLYQGHKTEFVYVYIHGLFKDDNQFALESYKSFHAGHNVVVGVLPGHENDPPKILKYYNSNDWVDYSHKLVKLARTLGDKVIYVGQSTGGLLGFFLASDQLVDGAILIQPSFGLSKEAVVASTFLGDLLTPIARMADRRVNQMSPEGGRMVEGLLRNSMTCLFDLKRNCSQVYSVNIPVVIYVDPHDLTVSTPATLKMVHQMNSSLIEVKKHHKGHMYIPDLTGDLRIPTESSQPN